MGRERSQLDDDFDTGLRRIVRTAAPAAWPAYVVMALSVAAIASAAVLRSFTPAVVVYSVVMVLGCTLLFVRRQSAIRATRRVGAAGYVGMDVLDRIALLALVTACVANGVIIAFEIASWEWGR